VRRRSAPGIAWLAIALVALAVRLVHLWQIHDTPAFAHPVVDGVAYDAWAQAIAGGDWIGTEVFYQAPLYPYVLATIYAAVGRDLAAVRIVQAVLGAASCILLGAAGTRFFDRRVGLAAALLLAVWPSAVFADGLIQKSALDVFLVCAFLAGHGGVGTIGIILIILVVLLLTGRL
jgi:4-amino-4-deoxy-L-arabinose transferase-like glycosyltransferase